VVCRARLWTCLPDGHSTVADARLVARLPREPLRGGAARLDGARFAVGPRAHRKKSEDGPCSDKQGRDKKPGTPTQMWGQTKSDTAAHGLLPIRSPYARTLPLRATTGSGGGQAPPRRSLVGPPSASRAPASSLSPP